LSHKVKIDQNALKITSWKREQRESYVEKILSSPFFDKKIKNKLKK